MGWKGEKNLGLVGSRKGYQLSKAIDFGGIVIILMFSNTIALCQIPLGLQLGLTLNVRVRNSAYSIYLKHKLCK